MVKSVVVIMLLSGEKLFPADRSSFIIALVMCIVKQF